MCHNVIFNTHTVIPAVNLYTAASLQESSDVGISRGLSPQLVPLQVGVVGGVDEVVREWLCHVLIHSLMLGINGWIVFASKKAAWSVARCFTHMHACHEAHTSIEQSLPDESSVRE